MIKWDTNDFIVTIIEVREIYEMKEKAKSALLIVFFALLVGWLTVSGIMDLANKDDLKTVKIGYAAELLEVEHSINGLIPTGTDHYYLGIDVNTYRAYVIKASGKWLKKGFDADGYSVDEEGLNITALSKKVSKYDVSKEISSRLSALEGLQYELGTDHFLEPAYKVKAILRIVMAIACIGLLVCGILFVRREGNVPKQYVYVWIVVLVAVLIMLLMVIR